MRKLKPRTENQANTYRIPEQDKENCKEIPTASNAYVYSSIKDGCFGLVSMRDE